MKRWLDYLMMVLVGSLIGLLVDLVTGEFHPRVWWNVLGWYFLGFLIWWLVLRLRKRKFCRTPQPA